MNAQEQGRRKAYRPYLIKYSRDTGAQDGIEYPMIFIAPCSDK
jgi:hypothetical protein